MLMPVNSIDFNIFAKVYPEYAETMNKVAQMPFFQKGFFINLDTLKYSAKRPTKPGAYVVKYKEDTFDYLTDCKNNKWIIIIGFDDENDKIYFSTKPLTFGAFIEYEGNYVGDKFFFEYLDKFVVKKRINKDFYDNFSFLVESIYFYFVNQNPLDLTARHFDDISDYIIDLVNLVSLKLDLDIELLKRHLKKVHTKKNHDYTGQYKDALLNFMTLPRYVPIPRYNKKKEIDVIIRGFLWRMGDKVSRIKTFEQKGVLLVENDSFEDALIDFISYLGLFYAYIRRLDRRKEQELMKKVGRKSKSK